jgi:hypothetical protein
MLLAEDAPREMAQKKQRLNKLIARGLNNASREESQEHAESETTTFSAAHLDPAGA